MILDPDSASVNLDPDSAAMNPDPKPWFLLIKMAKPELNGSEYLKEMKYNIVY